MPQQFLDFGLSTLASPITDSATAFSVASGHGARFDTTLALSTQDFLEVTLCASPTDPTFEVVRIIAPRATDAFPTIVRHPTRNKPWPAGTQVRAGLSAAALDDLESSATPFNWIASPVQWYLPIGGGSTLTNQNGAVSADGTATARNVSPTSYFTRQLRIGMVSAATAGSSVAVRGFQNVLLRSDGAGSGGFRHLSRFGISDAAAVADARMFVGVLAQSASVGNNNPTTVINCIGVGCDNGQSTLRIMHNDGTGTATTVDLGANFPANTINTDWYELELRSDPWNAGVRYWVRRLNTGHVATGTITTDLPASTVSMTSQAWRNNGATALAIGLDVGGIVHGPRT